MRYEKYVRSASLALGICLTLCTFLAGCHGTSMPATTEFPEETPALAAIHPTRTPKYTYEPTPTVFPTQALRPSPTSLPPVPCVINPNFPPPICEIFPGQTTANDIRQILGRPNYTYINVEPGHPPVPAGANADAFWQYTYSGMSIFSSLEVVFSEEIVIAVSYIKEIPLGQAITIYGPPEKVQVASCDGGLDHNGQWETFCSSAFLWPAEGVVMADLDYRPIEQLLESPIFSETLLVDQIWYFEPASLEEVVEFYYLHTVIDETLGGYHLEPLLIDWPGMVE